MTPELAAFQADYAALVARVGASGELFFSPQDWGIPHLEIAAGHYAYVVTERGKEIERRTTPDRDEALYWFVSDAVWGMATAFELAHRVPGRYSRRDIFDKEVELMARIKPEWATRKANEIATILARSPYTPSELV